MRRIALFSILGLCLFPLTLLAAGGGRSTGASPQSSTSTVTVTIPGVVGIDVESDLAFDFSSYSPPSSSTICAPNEFPPSPACTSGARYDPQVTHTPSLPGTAPDAGAIWLAVFCSHDGAASTMAIKTSITNFASSPGFSATALRYKGATTASTNPSGVGPGSETSFSNTLVALGNGTLPNTFGWTRADQKVDLLVPAATAFSDAFPSYAATITFEISKP